VAEENTLKENKKKKKIRHLSLQEIEAKLEEVKKHMGGFASKYAKALLKRREELREKESHEESGDSSENN
jgi:hypothetical protein